MMTVQMVTDEDFRDDDGVAVEMMGVWSCTAVTNIIIDYSFNDDASDDFANVFALQVSHALPSGIPDSAPTQQIPHHTLHDDDEHWHSRSLMY